MADIYTIVRVPVGHPAFAYHGRLTRADAVAQTRKHWQEELARLQKALAIPEDELDVRIVRGMHREELIKQL